MARKLEEWTGRTDDHRAPPKVRTRVFDREGGKCHICKQPIQGKKWALDHVKALINGGENREMNLKPIHVKCHAEKTVADVKEKAKVAAIHGKHIGAIQPKQSIASRPKPPKPAPKFDYTTRKSLYREARS